MKDILLDFYKRYPLMQVQDMVKLVYQHVFAGGHMIEDEKNSYRVLIKEMEAIHNQKPGADKPTGFEAIGNGLLRFHLQGLAETEISMETFNRFFVRTANAISGRIADFEKKLAILRECCKSRELPYPVTDLDIYLKQYKEKGYPPVSHSKAYRLAYAPAYRVIKSEYGTFFRLFEKIDALLRSRQSVNVAIDGNSGSGKSSLASLIESVYDCNVFHMDHFFLPPDLRTEKRLQETGGNIHYERFQKEVMAGIRSRDSFRYHVYDCSSETLNRVIKVEPKKLNVIEGCYSMHPTLVRDDDLQVFLHTDARIQNERVLKRSGPILYQRFLLEWIPMENRYFKEMKIREKCDLVFET